MQILNKVNCTPLKTCYLALSHLVEGQQPATNATDVAQKHQTSGLFIISSTATDNNSTKQIEKANPRLSPSNEEPKSLRK